MKGILREVVSELKDLIAEFLSDEGKSPGSSRGNTLSVRRRRKTKKASSVSGRSSSAESAVVMDEEEDEDEEDEGELLDLGNNSTNAGVDRVNLRMRQAEEELEEKDQEIKELQTRVRQYIGIPTFLGASFDGLKRNA